jgi:deoxyribonuclease-4
MKLIGAHVPTTGGVEYAPRNAHAMGASAFGMFTRNQRRWVSPALSPESIARFRAACNELGYGAESILPHDSYLINLGAPDAGVLDRSREAFLDELRRCEALGLQLLNFHPGAHKGEMSDEDCLAQISDEVNRGLDLTSGVTAVVEITAGQGSNVGYRMEHLAAIIEKVEDRSRIGVCLDTCHAFCAGYDLRTRESYEATMDEFERIIGLEYLKGIHLNDSKTPFESRRDRHENLGKGSIGWDTFRFVMQDPRSDGIPLILETPNPETWPGEIARLRELAVPA